MAASDLASAHEGIFHYMEPEAISSLFRNGRVLTRRDPDGSDDERVGVDLQSAKMPVANARELLGDAHCTLERNGFELVHRPLASPLDFFDHDAVLRNYYGECAELIRESTGATTVRAFDHNVRSAVGKQSKTRISGGQQVQGPAHVVHGDYTLTSAPQRLRDLSKQPSGNDTYRELLNEGESLLDPDEVERAISNGRFAIINLWRNIADEPVATHPLALCDAQTVIPDDLVVFEIHYDDRIGENYFAKHADKHRWYYYPAMTCDEALLIKQWDSAGPMAQSSGASSDAHTPGAPGTFSFHSAFEDPATPLDAPDRWSIEVRCAVLY